MGHFYCDVYGQAAFLFVFAANKDSFNCGRGFASNMETDPPAERHDNEGFNWRGKRQSFIRLIGIAIIAYLLAYFTGVIKLSQVDFLALAFVMSTPILVSAIGNVKTAGLGVIVFNIHAFLWVSQFGGYTAIDSYSLPMLLISGGVVGGIIPAVLSAILSLFVHFHFLALEKTGAFASFPIDVPEFAFRCLIRMFITNIFMTLMYDIPLSISHELTRVFFCNQRSVC